MIRHESQIGGIKQMYRVITLKSRSGVGEGPHLLMRWKIQVNPFNLPSDADAVDERPMSRRGAYGKQRA